MFDIDAYLQNALSHNTLPQALLFIGDGGEKYAKKLAAELLKSDLQRLESGHHPDYHILQPEGKSGLHTIESIRSLNDRVFRAPFESSGKVFVLHQADRMQPAAANALLKTLEEPLLDTHFILLSNDARQILPTVLSRCTQLFISNPDALKPIDFSNLPAEISRLEKEIDEMEDPVLQNRRVDDFLSTLMLWVRDAHAKAAGVPEEKLFFPDAAGPNHVPSLEKWEEILQKARFAYQRNIKLSICLEQLERHLQEHNSARFRK